VWQRGDADRQVQLAAHVLAPLPLLGVGERARRLVGSPGLQHQSVLGEPEPCGQPDGAPRRGGEFEHPGDLAQAPRRREDVQPPGTDELGRPQHAQGDLTVGGPQDDTVPR
jgi:hypothetical protein